MLLRTLLALAGLAAAGCAVGPAAVQRMDATKIQEISDYRLCDAAAVGLDLQRRRFPVIEGEIARRGVSCDEHIATVVRDCSGLHVVSAGTDSTGQGITFTVRNDSDQGKNFRIRREERQSRLLTIGPNETKRFGMTADPNVEWFEDAVETTEEAGGFELLECRSLAATYRFNYRPQGVHSDGAGVANEAPLPANPVASGARRRATRNVNMRAGPGTSHAVVGALRAGDEVTVVRVLGTWCEAVAGGRRRVYVSCNLLSPAPRGTASRGRLSTPDRAASGTPRLVPNTPYPQVRRQLMRSGWVPHTLRGRNFGCARGDERCRGFPETAFCSGIGRAVCIYTWRRGDRYLLIHAAGELPGQIFDAVSECPNMRVRPANPGEWWNWCSPPIPLQ